MEEAEQRGQPPAEGPQAPPPPSDAQAEPPEPVPPQGELQMPDGIGRLSELARQVEALLLASDEPLTLSKLSVLTGGGRKEIRLAIASLNDVYRCGGHSFTIEEIAEGYQMLTLGQFNDLLEQLLAVRRDTKLSQAALEATAVVAYKQPVTRADIEAIRGVACGEILRGLLEKRLVKIVGRAEILGRPMLYGTTRRFLEIFGLRNLEDLPKAEALKDPDRKAVERQTEEPKAEGRGPEDEGEASDTETAEKPVEAANDDPRP